MREPSYLVRAALAAPMLAIAATALSAPAMPPATGEPEFDARYAQAKANEGLGDYDARLAATFKALPTHEDQLTACMERHAPRTRVYGYFEFLPGGGYRVVLRPATPFAACVAAAFEGETLPEPPSRPYVHAVSFTPAPPAPAR